MNLESRYIVLKRKTVERCLSPEDKAVLANLCDKMELFLEVDMQDPFKCVVIEADWPEYDPTVALLADRVDEYDSGRRTLAYAEKLPW